MNNLCRIHFNSKLSLPRIEDMCVLIKLMGVSEVLSVELKKLLLERPAELKHSDLELWKAEGFCGGRHGEPGNLAERKVAASRGSRGGLTSRHDLL